MTSNSIGKTSLHSSSSSSNSNAAIEEAIYSAAFKATKKHLDDFRKQMPSNRDKVLVNPTGSPKKTFAIMMEGQPQTLTVKAIQTTKSSQSLEKQNKVIITRGPPQTPRQRIFLNKRPLHPKIEDPTTPPTALPTAGNSTIVVVEGNIFTALPKATNTSSVGGTSGTTHIIRLVQPTTAIAAKKRKAVTEEPVCLTISSDEEDAVPTCTKDEAALPNENAESTETIMLSCRCIRIGSFRCNVSSEKEKFDVLIKEDGFFFYFPSESGKPTLMRILSKDLQEILVSHNRSLPMIFLQMKPKAAEVVRHLMGMTKQESKVNFDPESQKIVFKWIILFPYSLPESFKIKLPKVFRSYNFQFDLESVKANSLLVQSTTDDIKTFYVEPSSFPKIQENGASSKLLVYPPPPMKGRITITTENLSCLDEGEFLNDNIIEFYLKYLYLEKISEEMRHQVHIFSTFFYYCLTTNHLAKSSVEPALPVEQRRYNRVKKWTRHIDLFLKKYIIIPINQQSHWFLTIICLDPVALDKIPLQQETQENEQTKLGCIYLFDSLDKPRHHWRVAAYLREYLSMEWNTKRPGLPQVFNTATLPAYFPSVPQQSNFSDCGVFVLQYAETFLKEPFENPSQARTHLESWFPVEEVEAKRAQLRSLILELAQR